MTDKICTLLSRQIRKSFIQSVDGALFEKYRFCFINVLNMFYTKLSFSSESF